MDGTIAHFKDQLETEQYKGFRCELKEKLETCEITTFKKSAKTVAEVANVFFFDENCVRNLEKRCKEEKIKWAKSNLQRQYIMKKKPLVSYIEGK